MAIPNMFRRVLNLIPFVASTAKNGFTRVLSFTGSFNDRTSTSLLLADGPVPDEQLQEPAPPSPSSQSQEAPAAPAMTSGTFDIEAAAAPPETLAGGQGEETTSAQGAEAKRVAKTVQTVCLFAASASLVLFVNLPGKPGGDGAGAAVEAEHAGAASVLYSVDLAFICLGFFTSLGLSMFSIVAKSGADDPTVARVQKRAMVMAVAFVLVSFTLRVCLMLPPATMESAWLVFVLLAGAVAVYMAIAWKLGGGPRGAGEVVATSSAGGAGTADRV